MPIACSFSSACRIALRHPHSFPTRRSSDLEATGGQLLVNREGAREFLESQGVPFPPGASAHFLPQSSRLIVRNTIDNRSEEHTSELQSLRHLVCRLLLEKKKIDVKRESMAA